MTILNQNMFPDGFKNEEELEDFMSTPSQALIDDMAKIEGDIAILGVGGKMGPTLARMAKRAAPDKNIIGVARFSSEDVKSRLDSWGVETIKCDLLERDEVAKLPQIPNIIYMAGKKFGTDGNEHFTWAMNTYAPALVGDHFRNSRIVSFSTILVYPFTKVARQGSVDQDPPMATPGEYANSCVGRERIIQHFSHRHGFSARSLRLAYSIDMRYGLLHEVANQVFKGETIDLTTGTANFIWQGDANSQTLRTLLHCTNPSSPIIISGPETPSIRSLAIAFGKHFGKEPKFTSEEADTCCVVNAQESAEIFGNPMVSLSWMIKWTADWVANDRLSWNMPCHYEVRDGVF